MANTIIVQDAYAHGTINHFRYDALPYEKR